VQEGCQKGNFWRVAFPRIIHLRAGVRGRDLYAGLQWTVSGDACESSGRVAGMASQRPATVMQTMIIFFWGRGSQHQDVLLCSNVEVPYFTKQTACQNVFSRGHDRICEIIGKCPMA
jgi:hypothetical protein